MKRRSDSVWRADKAHEMLKTTRGNQQGVGPSLKNETSRAPARVQKGESKENYQKSQKKDEGREDDYGQTPIAKTVSEPNRRGLNEGTS